MASHSAQRVSWQAVVLAITVESAVDWDMLPVTDVSNVSSSSERTFCVSDDAVRTGIDDTVDGNCTVLVLAPDGTFDIVASVRTDSVKIDSALVRSVSAWTSIALDPVMVEYDVSDGL